MRTSWEQQKDRLLPSFAKFVGKLAEKAAKPIPGVGEMFGTAIKESLDGLVAASEDLKTGGLTLPRLEYLQAQELMASVHQSTGRSIALVMDHWEETSNLAGQRNTLRDFLRYPEEWPACHIFLGAREGSEAAFMLDRLRREFPGRAEIHELGELDLSTGTERRRMVDFLRARVPGIWDADDDAVLDLVGGYPRVIDRWLADDAQDAAQTLDGLRRLVRESLEFRYSDLEDLLLGLNGDGRKLAVRVALVPLAEDADAWAVLRPIVMGDIDPNLLDDLKLTNVLKKDAEPPRFGHATRREAALSFLDARRPEAIKAEAARLALDLARSVTLLGDDVMPYLAALRTLRSTASARHLGLVPHGLCQAAASLFGEKLASPAALLDGVRQVCKSPEAGVGLVLAASLYATLTHAEAAGDRDGCHALLDALRTLCRACPDDAGVREWLAKGLFKTLNDAQAGGDLTRRDALLDELRVLFRACPDDTVVQKGLAVGLLYTLINAQAEDNLVRRDALLDELRGLASGCPEDAAVAEELARALLATVNDAEARNDFARRDALLDELRGLASRYPDDTRLQAVTDLIQRG